MDRLLCGDVGYGKNGGGPPGCDEMYFRRKAGRHFSATTVLAQQHYATACGRFRELPVKN